MSVREAVTNNLALKLAAIFLAVVLWLFAKGEQTANREFFIPLVLRNIPSGLTTAERVPDGVVAVFSGANKELWRTALWGDPYAVVDMSDAEAGRGFRVSLSAANVVLPPDADVQVMEVRDPSSLDLEIDRLQEKRVAVEPAVEGRLAEGYYMLGEFQAVPDSVTVFGPAGMVSRLSEVATAALSVEGRRARVEVTRAIVFEGPWNLSSVPREVRIVVPVEGTRRIDIVGVPVALEHEPGFAEAAVEPLSLDITLSGPEHIIEGLAAENVSVVVDARGLPKGTHELLPEITVPDQVEVVEFVPIRLTVNLD